MIRNYINIALNIIGKIVWILFSVLIFTTSFQRTLNNVLHIRNLKIGIVQKNKFDEHTSSEQGITTHINESTVNIISENKILTSHNIYELKIGDTVRVRDVGSYYNNIVFEVNGKTVGSAYDWLDYTSPFSMILAGIAIYYLVIWRIYQFFQIRRREF